MTVKISPDEWGEWKIVPGHKRTTWTVQRNARIWYVQYLDSLGGITLSDRCRFRSVEAAQVAIDKFNAKARAK